jgi:hypothetical protein
VFLVAVATAIYAPRNAKLPTPYRKPLTGSPFAVLTGSPFAVLTGSPFAVLLTGSPRAFPTGSPFAKLLKLSRSPIATKLVKH